MVRQSYAFQNVPPNISSTHLAPYGLITTELTIFPIRYSTSPWLFCNYQPVLLNPFTVFTEPPNPHTLWQPSVCSLFLWVILSANPMKGGTSVYGSTWWSKVGRCGFLAWWCCVWQGYGPLGKKEFFVQNLLARNGNLATCT